MISGIFAFDFECSIIYKESRNISNAPAVQSTAGARLYSDQLDPNELKRHFQKIETFLLEHSPA